ncbi:MAG TPA: gas vesicle protein [Gaiellaceae bacterium]
MSSIERRTVAPAAIHPSSASLADILERVLDKGVVIAGDIGVNLLDVELLTLKLRLLIASADTAQAMGIDWWKSDPNLSSRARELSEENRELRERLERIESLLAGANGNAVSQLASAHDEPATR